MILSVLPQHSQDVTASNTEVIVVWTWFRVKGIRTATRSGLKAQSQHSALDSHKKQHFKTVVILVIGMVP